MNKLHLGRTIWERSGPMLINQVGLTGANRGRARVNERRAYLGFCYLPWSGCSWRALPREYGARSTVNRFFLKWSKSGIFRELGRVTLVILNENKLISDKIQMIDGSRVLVQNLPKSIAFDCPKYRPKRAIKFSLLIDAQGTLLSVVLGIANGHDTKLLPETLGGSLLNIRESTTRKLLGDKGYVGARQELTAKAHGLVGIFHPRKNQRDQLEKSSIKKLKKH